MANLLALTRDISPSIVDCELTHLTRTPIDLARAREQHASYEDALRLAGCDVRRLAAGPAMPDSVFIEDTAIVIDELAIVTRPGAPSRRKECVHVAETLADYRTVAWIEPPGTIDGGDVLLVGQTIFVGLSSRTNAAAVDQMESFVSRFGYDVRRVAVTGCLHLKSAVSSLGQDRLLMNRAWVDSELFAGLEIVDVAPDPAEAYAANAVAVDGGVIYPTAFPRTRERLESHGVRVIAVDASELAKAEGAVTCCSLIFSAQPSNI